MGIVFFYVMPTLEELTSQVASRTVFFPDLALLSTSEWHQLEKADLSNTPEIIQQFSSYTDVQNRIKTEFYISDEEIKKIQNEWESVSSQFRQMLKGLLEDVPEFEEVNLYLTRIGTVSTYTPAGNTLNVYFRTDADISHIAEVVLAAIIRKQLKDFSVKEGKHYGQFLNWHVNEGIVDYLMMHTQLKVLFPNFNATTEGIDLTKDSGISAKSLEYLKKLGFDPDTSLKVEKDYIKDAAGNILKGLTNQEFLVLRLLIEKTGETCTYEDIAKVLWEKDYLEKFSMYALNKIIFQIRGKLRLNKQFNVVIKTKRNAGYVLFT